MKSIINLRSRWQGDSATEVPELSFPETLGKTWANTTKKQSISAALSVKWQGKSPKHQLCENSQKQKRE